MVEKSAGRSPRRDPRHALIPPSIYCTQTQTSRPSHAPAYRHSPHLVAARRQTERSVGRNSPAGRPPGVDHHRPGLRPDYVLAALAPPPPDDDEVIEQPLN